MLVLARRVDEGAVIELEDGRRIAVVVVAVSERGCVKLGFDAPATVSVHRHEIQAIVDRERGRS